MSHREPIPIIDIFAGPGGLGEGFSALSDKNGDRVFRIPLSIEMDEYAHRTLLLRSFFRQFPDREAPSAYYEYVRGEERWRGASVYDLLTSFPSPGAIATAEAWHKELRPGAEEEVDQRINAVLGSRRTRGPWGLVGGPPCQAYSLVGRARMLGTLGRQFYADKRHTLYKEYLRLISEHVPTFFVMENVKGLLSSSLEAGERVFERILTDLRQPPKSKLRYRLYSLAHEHGLERTLFGEIEDHRSFVIECERYGIPQARHRVIIVGVLETELGTAVKQPRKLLEYPGATVGDVIQDLPRLRSGLSSNNDSPDDWKATLAESVRAPWYKSLRSNGSRDVAEIIEGIITSLRVPRAKRGGRFVQSTQKVRYQSDWYDDPRLGGACNHETRGHRADDLHRYLFVSSFGRARAISPRLRDFPRELLPAHANVRLAVRGGLFDDRFRVQIASRPGSTITAHIAKDGHGFIHPDPAQCRSLSVREAARVQTFPDSYFFEGPRTEQYRQVGNAVPPLLARQIAGVIAEMLGQSAADTSG